LRSEALPRPGAIITPGHPRPCRPLLLTPKAFTNFSRVVSTPG
jgi:hypothetical protein